MKPFNEEDTQKLTEEKKAAMHGDVVLQRIDEMPDGLETCKEPVLAYGEATGHLHKLFGEQGDFELKQDKQGTKYLKVNNVIYLKHQEHRPIEIHPGVFRIGIQREYDPFSKRIREVAD